jgi:hypothetical protein
MAVTTGVVALASGADRFPFAMPGLDATRTAVDVSALNGAIIGEERRVQVNDGHLTDSSGKRVRLLGVNLSFGANFPTHADAEALAAHLAKFGINAVRHHHMDARDIWKINTDGTRQLDPAKLELLAYLITQLGKHGIYSDVNIHVSRTFTEKEGFPQADKLGHMNKYTLYIVPRMRDLWKEYARDLLTYKNPHTGRRLADEPSVAIVEITNENALSPRGFAPLADVPEQYREPLRKRWNAWLKARYGSTAALRKAWGESVEKVGGDIAFFGDFSRSHEPWILMDHGATKADVRTDRPGPKEGSSAIRVSIDRVTGKAWELEFARTGLSVEKGRVYTLSFWIRAAEPREVEVDVSRNGEPWNVVGFLCHIKADKNWQQHTYTFRATETLKGNARWIFKIGQKDADVWLADAHLRAGGELRCIPADESLEADTVSLPISPSSEACQRDTRTFLVVVETVFFEDTYRYLKDQINVRAPVCGTQTGYVDLRSLALLDFVDSHAYWEHPQWRGQAWTPRGWTIGNTPTVRSRDGGSLPRLASDRVVGKPFTVSEYNQPAPNEYQAECAPTLAILAALQDWDGVFIYSFQHGNQAWRAQRIQQFFDVNGNPLVMALLPTAAEIFRRGDVSPCRELLTQRLGDAMPAWQAWVHRVGTDLSAGEPETPTRSHARPTWPIVSDNGQFTCDNRQPEAARFLLNTPRTKMAAGFIGGSKITLDELTIEPRATDGGFGVIAVTSLDGESIVQSRRLLITTIAHAENTGMAWNAQRNSVDDRWGISPPLVQIAPATLTVRSPVTVAYALDATGARSKGIPIVREGPAVRLAVDPADKAVWYELCASP